MCDLFSVLYRLSDFRETRIYNDIVSDLNKLYDQNPTSNTRNLKQASINWITFQIDIVVDL